MAEGKVLHLKVQSRNPPDLFAFRRLKRLTCLANFCNILLTKLGYDTSGLDAPVQEAARGSQQGNSTDKGKVGSASESLLLQMAKSLELIHRSLKRPTNADPEPPTSKKLKTADTPVPSTSGACAVDDSTWHTGDEDIRVPGSCDGEGEETLNDLLIDLEEQEGSENSDDDLLGDLDSFFEEQSLKGEK